MHLKNFKHATSENGFLYAATLLAEVFDAQILSCVNVE